MASIEPKAMDEDLQPGTEDDTSLVREWQQALDDLERSLRDAGQAVTLLRRGLDGGGRAARLAEAAQAGEPVLAVPRPAIPAQGDVGRSAFDRLWDRIEGERETKPEDTASEPAEERRGLDLLPQQYVMTVEDQEGAVDLIPLHRALLGLEVIQEISLVSYANGVPVISLRTEGELDLVRLDDAVSEAMDRQCEVIPQDNGKLYLCMTARQD